jgi:fluoride ion exporter CrcB/FEX
VSITIGFLGSFTTFSGILTVWLGLTYASEPFLGVAYLLATGVGGFLAAYGGLEAGQWWRKVSTPNGVDHD